MWPSVQIGRAARAAVVGALLFPVAVCGVATPAFGAESVATPAERVPASPATALEGLDYLTEEWAPFNYTLHGKPVGISVDILEAALRNAGVAQPKPKVRTVPLAEGLEMAAQGPGKVLFAIVRTPEREPRYQWAGPFTKANFVLYALARRNLAIARPEDFQRYSIGTVTASIENDLLARQGVPSTRVANRATPGELLRMLEAGEIDLWATGDLAGRHQMRQTANNPNAFEVVHTLSENDLYYVFSRDVPATLVHAFQAALAAVRDRKDEHGVSAYERIIYRNLGVGCARQSFSNDAVVALVDATAAAIAADAAGTLASINNREAPYRDARDPGLYVFVYDLNTTMVAHADNRLVIGVNFHGKGDVEGTPLHDRIRDGALRDGSGWVDYVFLHPVQMNLYYKSAYHRLTRGSDGQSYIVASGNYKRCE